MKHKNLLFVSLLILGLLTLFSVVRKLSAQEKGETSYKEIAVVNPPGGLVRFDISWVDSASRATTGSSFGPATATVP